jgi:hypothetical protein
MGVVIDGVVEAVPGVSVVDWLGDRTLPRLKVREDCRARYTRWIRGIVLHTTKGIPGGTDHRPQVIKPGLGPNRKGDYATARYWATTAKQSGAHLVVDFDGSVVCLADLLTEASYHAGEVNEVSIGIEIYQGDEAELYAGQLDAVVRLLDFLTRRFKIQRQLQYPYRGGPVPRIAAGAQDVVGIYGHRDVTTNRGAGDPGDAVFEALFAAGYERFDFSANTDKAAWRQRQETLNTNHGTGLIVNGIPDQLTVAALIASGRTTGLWLARPSDPAQPPPVG